MFDVQIDRIAFPQTLPDWLFDAKQYRVHQNAREPDIVERFVGP